VLPPGISKGFALKKLAQYMGIDIESIVAVGDAPNDIEMIEIAGLGAAVENADDLVKACSDIIVKPVGEGGIAELISIAFGL
jgi:hydroxymethylpyrimidine pyrophosphatase-like HAD family hydrolase